MNSVDIYPMLFCIYWDDYVGFVFSFVDMVYHIRLCILNHPGMNLVWSWSLMYCWIWFANFLENFCIYIHQRYVAVIFF